MNLQQDMKLVSVKEEPMEVENIPVEEEPMVEENIHVKEEYISVDTNVQVKKENVPVKKQKNIPVKKQKKIPVKKQKNIPVKKKNVFVKEEYIPIKEEYRPKKKINIKNKYPRSENDYVWSEMYMIKFNKARILQRKRQAKQKLFCPRYMMRCDAILYYDYTRLWICELCGKGLLSPNAAINHDKKCQPVFWKEEHVTEEMNRIMEKNMLYPCLYCALPFTRKVVWRRHMKYHSKFPGLLKISFENFFKQRKDICT